MSIQTSVITLTHNKLAYTRLCLSSLLRTAAPSWELVVVDNGSTDGTLEWLTTLRADARAVGVDVTVVANGGNIGCSTARNRGFAASRGEQVVFVDNDVALRSADWLVCLGDELARDPGLGIVGPKLVYPAPPHAIQFAGGDVTPSGRVIFRGRGEPRDSEAFNQPRDVQCFISACFMLPRRVFEASGGFDELFNPVEYEDIDLSYKVRSQGRRIRYVPSVEMYHFENVTTEGTPKLPNTYLIIKNGMAFKKRWRHMFAGEGGPDDSEAAWREIPPQRLDDIGTLPVVSDP